MKLLKSLAISVVLLSMVACSPIEQQARNSAAALGGLLAAAQTQYQAGCTTNPSQSICTTINQAISGENALITATEAYCGWSAASPPGAPSQACVPVKTATAGLQTAIANANSFISQLKGAVK